MSKALITGITGQDGAYLAKLLLEKGYHVIGAHRRTSAGAMWRLQELGVLGAPKFELRGFDVTDPSSCRSLVKNVEPAEIYNLAAQSFVGVSFDQPHLTTEATGIGTLNMLEALRVHAPKARFYQASSSEMFGNAPHFQKETTPLRPRSPYGAAKVLAHNMAVIYREAYNLHVCCGILFNHESPLRGEEFVTRKITKGLAEIEAGKEGGIKLGNLDAYRDWGHAMDYVRGMWLMLQHHTPDDYVLATGHTRTIWDFFQSAALAIGFDPVRLEHPIGAGWRIVDNRSGRSLAHSVPEFYRPAEVNLLCGDASKAANTLGWVPMVDVNELSREMVQADQRRLKASGTTPK